MYVRRRPKTRAAGLLGTFRGRCEGQQTPRGYLSPPPTVPIGLKLPPERRRPGNLGDKQGRRRTAAAGSGPLGE